MTGSRVNWQTGDRKSRRMHPLWVSFLLRHRLSPDAVTAAATAAAAAAAAAALCELRDDEERRGRREEGRECIRRSKQSREWKDRKQSARVFLLSASLSLSCHEERYSERVWRRKSISLCGSGTRLPLRKRWLWITSTKIHTHRLEDRRDPHAIQAPASTVGRYAHPDRRWIKCHPRLRIPTHGLPLWI